MAEVNKKKLFEISKEYLTRHEKKREERWKRQSDALRANLKKRKAQKQQRDKTNK